MITPRQVFRYSVAATAGYALTAPVVEWLLAMARWMSSIALLSFILAAACIYTWFDEPFQPGRGRLLIWAAALCCLSVVLLTPMAIVTRIALRCSRDEENE